MVIADLSYRGVADSVPGYAYRTCRSNLPYDGTGLVVAAYSLGLYKTRRTLRIMRYPTLLTTREVSALMGTRLALGLYRTSRSNLVATA
eukprot:3887294-Rhodomonas_salina.3